MKKGLFNVMVANIICLIINLLTNFLLPKFLTIDSYSMIKTYSLYLTYAGFFSVGYNDGMYLQYGGKKIQDIPKKELADNFLNYVILMLGMLVVVFGISIWINDPIIKAFAFGMFSYNILGYLKSLYQATGEFSAYGVALNIEKVLVFLFTMSFIFIIHSDDYRIYIWIQVIVGIFLGIYLFTRLERKLHFIQLGKFKISECKENIFSGFILMLGNFSSSIFTGLDRWFVKILLTNIDFAMYSFAVSMESVINVFISPITIYMYNYFCKKPSLKNIRKIKKITLIWAFLVIAAAFPAKWILENFLQNYIMANSVVFILFVAQVFYIIVKGIYVNIYKSEKKQSLYLKQMIMMIIISIILNSIFYAIFKNMVSIAVGTLITAIIWMYLCELTSLDFRFGIKENISIIILTLVFLLCGYYMNAIIGCIIYIASLIIVSVIFMPDATIYLIKIARDGIILVKNKIMNKK